MAKQWTREELTALTPAQFAALTKQEQEEVKKAGFAFKTGKA